MRTLTRLCVVFLFLISPTFFGCKGDGGDDPKSDGDEDVSGCLDVCYTVNCYHGDLYCFDACGKMGELSQTCVNGCQDGACRTLDSWIDESSGLLWLRQPSTAVYDWYEANEFCSSHGLRLPSLSELRTLIRGREDTATAGACSLTDGCPSSACYGETCKVCPNPNGGPNGGCYVVDELYPRDNGSCGWFWSASTKEDEPDQAWFVAFDCGGIYSNDKSYGGGIAVRCVKEASPHE